MATLSIGERELINRFVRPILGGFNPDYLADDCAVLRLDSERSLLVTTDAGPRKTFLRTLDVGTPFDLGHFFSTISLSDIAAMGGEPLGLVAAFMMNPNTTTLAFNELVQGVSEACREAGAGYLGGDTKEGDDIRVVTTAVGITHPDRILGRRGARPGDLIAVSGQIGTTLKSYLIAAHEKRISGRAESVVRPRARIEFGKALSESHLATACIDMSDGPIAAAKELAESNGVRIEIDVSKLDLAKAPLEHMSTKAWHSIILNVGGDFELMFTGPPTSVGEIEKMGGVICGEVKLAGSVTGVDFLNLTQEVEITPFEHFKHSEWVIDKLRDLI